MPSDQNNQTQSGQGAPATIKQIGAPQQQQAKFEVGFGTSPFELMGGKEF